MPLPILTINATIADERSNSYIVAQDFIDYWTGHYDQTTAATMLALSTTAMEMLLVRACRTLETLHFTEPVDPLADFHLVYDSRQQQIRSVKTNYGRPQKYNYFQHLQFPRTLDIYSDGTLFIPPEVQAAQCEQAAYELTFDPSILINSLQGLTRDMVRVGDITLDQSFGGSGSGGGALRSGTMLSPVAYNMVKPYLIRQIMRLQRA